MIIIATQSEDQKSGMLKATANIPAQ